MQQNKKSDHYEQDPQPSHLQEYYHYKRHQIRLPRRRLVCRCNFHNRQFQLLRQKQDEVFSHGLSLQSEVHSTMQ